MARPLCGALSQKSEKKSFQHHFEIMPAKNKNGCARPPEIMKTKETKLRTNNSLSFFYICKTSTCMTIIVYSVP